MKLTRAELVELAKQGARVELNSLQVRTEVLENFLKHRSGKPTKWTAKQREAHAKRMKMYWAKQKGSI